LHAGCSMQRAYRLKVECRFQCRLQVPGCMWLAE
jgi:hypothetical protein